MVATHLNKFVLKYPFGIFIFIYLCMYTYIQHIIFNTLYIVFASHIFKIGIGKDILLHTIGIEIIRIGYLSVMSKIFILFLNRFSWFYTCITLEMCVCVVYVQKT